MLASTRQPRSQNPVTVNTHRTEGVTGSERREGADGIEGGNGDVNIDIDGDVNVDRDGDGAGRRTRVDVNEESKMGTGTEAGTEHEGWRRGEYAQENPEGFGRDVANRGDFD